jgi:phosphatidylglycerol---prolipoprotein diacylglyceryl transferase
LIIAYGVARVGCHLAGDGDYGFPTTLPWGTIYAHGTAKPSEMLRGTTYLEEHPATRAAFDSLTIIPAGRDQFGLITRFDEVTPMHPTPIYELLLATGGFALLWGLRKRAWPDGLLFMLYLTLTGAFRFAVEFLRLNPHLLFGLSEAQLIAVPIMAVGIFMMIRIATRAPKA